MNGVHVRRLGIVEQSVELEWTAKGTGDFDGDGVDDVLWWNTKTREVSLWLMRGLAMPKTRAILAEAPSSGWQPWGVGGFDGDGRADILWYDPALNRSAIWFMDGAVLRHADLVSATPDSSWGLAGCEDCSGDGYTDLVWWNSDTREVAVWLMNGSTIMRGGITDTLP